MNGARRVGGAALLLAGLVLAAGASSARADGDKKTDDGKDAVIVTEKENDARIRVAKGRTILVKLPVQGGTGYTWTMAKHDKERLKLVSETTEKPEKMLPGGRVIRVYRFTAEAAGTTELELHYRRPFEKDKAPAKTLKVTFVVD
jgi:predicted secreted protein